MEETQENLSDLENHLNDVKSNIQSIASSETEKQTSFDEKIKKSTDITIDPVDLKKDGYSVFNDYFKKLNECYIDYKEQYPFLNSFLKKTHIGHFNIQKYLAGDHFARLHSERTNIGTSHRIFTL